MKKRLSYQGFLITLAAVVVLGCFHGSGIAGSVKKVCYKQHCLKVNIAVTPSERDRGLMFQKDLPQDQGMLFIFDQQDLYGFWMKNTYIPLDIVWINENLRVVYIERNAQPCLNDVCTPIEPGQKACYVLEGNSGFVSKMGVRVGDSLDFVY